MERGNYFVTFAQRPLYDLFSAGFKVWALDLVTYELSFQSCLLKPALRQLSCYGGLFFRGKSSLS